MSLRLWVLAATALGALLRARGLWLQPATADELNAIPAALGYLEGSAPGPLMPNHPHLRDLVLAGAHALFGPGVLAARGPSLLLGTACIPLLAALVWRLSRNARAAALAAALLAIDPVSIFFSRLAYQDVWTAFFALLGAWCAAEAVLGAPGRRPWLLAAAGVAFGLGTAAKFNVIPVWGVCAALVVLGAVRARRWSDAAYAVAALGLLPVLVYAATWWPWFHGGGSAAEWLVHQAERWDTMSRHHRAPEGALRFSHPWRWFAVPFEGWSERVLSPGGVGLTFAVGNPVVWLLALPACAWALWRNRARRAEVVFLLLFAATWGSMLLPSRQIWILSSLTVVPFAFALIALAAADLEARSGAVRARTLVHAWLAVAVAASLALHPALIGKAHEVGYLRPLLQHLTGGAG